MAKIDLPSELLTEAFDPMAVGFMRSDAQLFSEIYGDLSREPSEQARARKAAANFIAATVAGVGRLALAHAQTPEADIVPVIESGLLLAAFENYQEHRRVCEYIQDDILVPAIQCDIDTGKAALKARLATLTQRKHELHARVEAAGKPAVALLLETASYIAEGVEEAVKLASGIPVAPTISDEQLSELIARNREQLMMFGATAVEADKELADALGTTPEQQRASIARLSAKQLVLESEGTKIGAIVSGQFEADLAEAAFDQVEALLGA